MKVLVTGGAGVIGSYVVRLLLRESHEVTVLDGFKLGGRGQFESTFPEVELIDGDMVDGSIVERAVAGHEAILHLAAPSSFLMYKEDVTGSTVSTVHGFLNILEGARKNDIDIIVHASTSAVYEGNPVPYHEDMDLPCPDLKSLSKKVNEEMGELYAQRYGLRVIGLRPFSVYSDAEYEKKGYANIISLLSWAMLGKRRPILWGDGSQTRDFIFASDVAQAFLTAMESDLSSDVFNVGTGKETSFNEVVEIINETLGMDLRPRYVQVPIDIYALRLLADTSKARNVLGFTAETSVREGIQRVLEKSKPMVENDSSLSLYQEKYSLHRRFE